MSLKSGLLAVSLVLGSISASAALADEAPVLRSVIRGQPAPAAASEDISALLGNGGASRAQVRVTTQAACGGFQYVDPRPEDHKACGPWMLTCEACVYDSGCTITDNRDKPVGGTNRRSIIMMERSCYCDLNKVGLCTNPQGQIIPPWTERLDFGDCSRCQP